MRNQDSMRGSQIAWSLSIVLAAVFAIAATTPTLPTQQRARRARRPTTAAPQQRAYDRAYGIYSATNKPTMFGDYDDLTIALTAQEITHNGAGVSRGIEADVEFTKFLDRPERVIERAPGGQPFEVMNSNRRTNYRVPAPEVTTNAVSFTTAEVNGVSYRFEGRFTNARPTKRQIDPIALEGKLTKLERGREVAAADLKFTVDRGD